MLSVILRFTRILTIDSNDRKIRNMQLSPSPGKKLRTITLCGLAGAVGVSLPPFLSDVLKELLHDGTSVVFLADWILRRVLMGLVMGCAVATTLIWWRSAVGRLIAAASIAFIADMGYSYVEFMLTRTTSPSYFPMRTSLVRALVLASPVVILQVMAHHMFLTRPSVRRMPWLTLGIYVACGCLGMIPEAIRYDDYPFVLLVGACIGYCQLFAMLFVIRYEMLLAPEPLR